MISFNKGKLPEKIFLSGADCFHLVLEKHAKKHGAGGNVMRKVFYFSHKLSHPEINRILKSSPVIHWLCNIKLVQGSFFALPYWKYKDEGREIILLEHEAAVENEIPEAITQRDITIASTRFIEADLVYYPSGCCAFVVSWNHILLDARGSTLLFEHLNCVTANKKQDEALFFPAKPKTANIIRYIRNMYQVKKFIQSSAKAPVSSVAYTNTNSKARKTKNHIIAFNEEQTKKISANAIKTGSRFGPTLYLVACCAQVTHLLNKQRDKAGDIWLPVPYDGRLSGAKGPLISNCVSFLFYRIKETDLQTVKQTVQSLSQQMKWQINNNIPKKYTLFLNMMRYVPLWLYYFLINKTGNQVFASFLYTSTGDNFNDFTALFEKPIRNLNMIPALTFPPGLTFVFLKHENEFNINIAFATDIIRDSELQFIENHLTQILLADY